MKSSLSKLRRIALHKHDVKEQANFQPSVKFDELAQATKDMQEMRNCYDSLLSAAAATANSAYEFSESLREMGSCLLEKTALHDDEESGRLLTSLGKGQFELQKLVDSYRSHVFLTITNPSESLLNELRTVEEMKRQCDEKRDVYEYMTAQRKEKGRSKSGKGETITSQQLQAAHDEYDEEATLCVFRLKSLKQGQSRSLLTQAARHHTAQLNFFRKGLQSLEAVEPHVRLVAQQKHIDFHFSELEENDVEEDDDDGENNYDVNEGRELSFDYRSNIQGLDVVSTSQNSVEVEEVGLSFPRASTVETAETDVVKSERVIKVSNKEPRVSSFSAPIFPEKYSDPAEKVRQLQMSSTRKANTYVLPTPCDAKETNVARTSTSGARTSTSGRFHNSWHSSPLEEKHNEKCSDANKFSEGFALKSQSILKESNSHTTSAQLPLPLSEGISLPQIDTTNPSDVKKAKRQAFSGPLPNKSWSIKTPSASGPIGPTELPRLLSGVLTQLPKPQTSSRKVSPSASPPLVSSPKISELHELPRPPGILATKPAISSANIGHSAPLVHKNQDLSAANEFISVASSSASPLPPPPLVVPRSFSIPSSSQRAMALHVAKLLDTPQVPDKVEEHASPPLTPISLSKSIGNQVSLR
ncbi:Hydroxyproline-rich glycoprotein family protein [Quillaja saponaria]|uniref:Hydroxyproline-rich glycoprotein family protein n=1 Tax=Quillaja saponaria TaxID=32244 RepID=A0AAD7Q7F3_QUISA|nr:Hydroxyproline-rich glycoprotein family protein [Quillaja saponaria]KAJ7976272.1 Hydroxyproline-rich glycoprotein family protein [Quillaja saponaria]